MDTKRHVLSYGIRSIKNMKASSSSSSMRQIVPVRDIENYLTNRVDYVVSRCITYLLCAQPSSTLETLHFMLKYFSEIKVFGNYHHEQADPSKPRYDQKLLLSTTIGPIISKLVNRMIFVRPTDPISYFIDEIKMMIHLNSDNCEPTNNHSNNEEPIESLPPKKFERPESAPIAVASKEKVNRPVSALETSSSLRESKPHRKVQIGLFGLGGAGKTTILSCIQGELNRNVKPTIGFRPVTMSLDASTTVCFYDLGGSSKIREIWPQYYHDIHGSLFVVDSRSFQTVEGFVETKSVFDSFFQSSSIKSKPLLIVINAFDNHVAVESTELLNQLNIDTNTSLIKVIQCLAGGLTELSTDTSDDQSQNIDPRIEEGVDWLISAVSANYSMLNERVISDTAARYQEELKKQVARERKVLKSKIASIFYNDLDPSNQSEHEPSAESDILSQSEGIEFLSSEIGEDVNALPTISQVIAKSVGYQRLALQIVGALKAPISKKKTPMSWENIILLVNDIRQELGLPVETY
jgi:small GTP-binding protein